ncbi:family 78 glycoside hydrolase catalytic domain [Mucilaginibacter sp. AW1-7]|uniref:alpha-L-rhamnosidase n=1 Tax=Mucilaginibacter sp. AW1-7 TaxID=3349874 RepID=UPI003F741093
MKMAIKYLVVMAAWQSTNALAQPFKAARWITVPYAEGTGKRNCPLFEKSFVTHKPIAKAVLTITALGLYEANINGKRVSDAYFTPGFTVYNKRLQYQQYEVTKLLSQKNTLKVLIGEGWYRGTFRNENSDEARNNFGNEAGLIAELNIAYKDGSHTTIATGPGWTCRKSNIQYSELYDGEMQETRNSVQSSYPAKLSDVNVNLVLQESEYVKKHETFSPVRIFRTPKGEQVADFGQNLAGWVKLTIKRKAGDTIKLGHAELLDNAGNFYAGNLRTAKAEDIYILNGEAQTLEPHFTYHGFRYIKLQGTDATKVKLQAIAIYTDLKPTGTFACSDSLINKLYQNISWSLKSNFVDIPTDCPQRSERLGWTGDAQVFAGTAMYLYDTKRFYSKWLRDLEVEQGSNGAVPNFLPRSMPNTDVDFGVAGWGDAATIMPWTLYQAYGDKALLREQYPVMKKWVDYMTSVSKEGLFLKNGYGDWYAMGASTSVVFIDQCFYAYSTRLVRDAAKVLGHAADVQQYETLYSSVVKRFREVYGKFNRKDTRTQTAYVLALAFDLLPENERAEAAKLLAENIRSNGNKQATGFLGTPYLLPVLSRFGYSTLAYTLLEQQECPSWLYPVTKGATTIWERWDAIKPDGTLQEASFNHYSYGAVGQWLYHNMAGISALEPGYRKIQIKPETGTLNWCKASLITPQGKVAVHWQKLNGKLKMTVTVPKGTTAMIYVPKDDNSGYDLVNAGAGTHEYTSKE